MSVPFCRSRFVRPVLSHRAMLKSWRRFFLYFLVVLGILLGLRILLQWKFIISRAKESAEEDQSPLIIDPNCLAKLAAGQECDYPIGIAIWEKAPIDLSPFLHVEFLLDELKPERNFWLFKNSTDPSKKIATKIFATKLASLRTNDTMLAHQLRVPADLAAFSRAWGHGRFLECRPLIVRSPNVERLIPLDYLDRVVQFTDLISQHNATAFILGGTLLGWRRECSLIPHTADIDLTIFSEQHSDALLRAILTSKTFIVHWVLGRLRDSFELSVNADGFKIDLFYLYRSENASYIGGMRPQKRQRMRWKYPLLSEICAGEMHGRLLHLPCEHEKVIEADYGAEEWKAPKDTEARWDKANPNHQSLEVYGDEEWPNVYLLVQNKTERFVPAKLDEWMARIGKTA